MMGMLLCAWPHPELGVRVAVRMAVNMAVRVAVLVSQQDSLCVRERKARSHA